VTVSLDNCPALVLNADFRPLSYFPLSLWSWQDAVKAVFLDRVNIIDHYDVCVRSPSLEMQLPSVVSLKEYVPAARHPAFTRFNVFLRDRFTCQYCGEPSPSHELTFDHLVPRSRGGRTVWTNVVTACATCNLWKGNRLPRESAKNADKARDPEMHQTKKGNQWYFGMKAHFGVDSRSKLIHAVQATPANVADSAVLPNLLHGNETRVWGDQAYRGQRAVIRQHAPKARDFTNRRYRHRGVVDEVERAKNRTKSKVRAKVEHAIGVIKRVFGFAKVRYRGLKKNAHRLLVACALANLFIARRHLLPCDVA
jgi:5-methylcytosine-specific restriction endonuclease McrA